MIKIRRPGFTLFLLLVLVVGIAVSFGSFILVKRHENKAIEAEFVSRATDLARGIKNSIDDNATALYSIRDLYRASQSVEREEFYNFTTGLLALHPDIYEFRLIKRIKGSERAYYETSLRKEGFPEPVIREFDRDYNLIRASDRDEYFPITYVEPLNGRKDAIGIDASSDPLRWAAMKEARDTGLQVGSGNILLKGENTPTYAFRNFLPIYRNDAPHNTIQERRDNLLGFAVLVFRMEDVIDLTLKGWERTGIDICVCDEAVSGNAYGKYFCSREGSKGSRAIPENEFPRKNNLQYKLIFDSAQRSWSVICIANPEFLREHRRYSSWLALFAGLLLTGLLLAYLYNILNRSLLIEIEVKQRTDELNKANSFNAALLSTIPFPMDIVDENGNIVYLNEKMEGVVGKDAIGKKCWMEYKDNGERCDSCPLIKGIEMDKTHTIEASGVLGGKVFQISHTGMVFAGKKAVLEIFEDITDKKKSEEKLAELSAAVQQGPAVVVIADTEGNIEYINPKFTQLTGYSMEEALGKNPRILKSGEHSQDFYKNLWDTIRSGREWRGEFRNKKKSGELYWESASISSIKNDRGEISHFIAIKEDITVRKMMEAELVRANEQLMKIDQLKSEFVSTVSHELRTPLAITKEGISLIIDKIAGEINEKQMTILVTARENIDRLARIIGDLLDISRIEAGRVVLKKEKIDITALAGQALSTFEPRIKQKGLGLKKELPSKEVYVYADSDKIIQVFTNLLGNALKFTDKGHIGVSIAEKAGVVECAVFDTGTGIAQENIPKLFGKFQQFGRVPGAGEKGTGLGLSIAKGLTELHRGKICVESALGKGTKFILLLPKFDPEMVFKEHIDDSIHDAVKRDTRVSLVLVSIADFDKTKASISESRFSDIMKEMTSLLKNSLHKEGDVVAKDTSEIIVLLSDCNKDSALSVMARLKQALEDYLQKGNLSGKVGLCFKSVTFPDDGGSEAELLNKVRV